MCEKIWRKIYFSEFLRAGCGVVKTVQTAIDRCFAAPVFTVVVLIDGKQVEHGTVELLLAYLCVNTRLCHYVQINGFTQAFVVSERQIAR